MTSTAAITAASAADNVDVEVLFGILAETNLGDRVCVVGATSELGAWVPNAGLELKTSAEVYPYWSGKILLPLAQALGCIEYKFVILRGNGCAMWEPGENRHVAMEAPADSLKEVVGGDQQVLHFGEKPRCGLRAHTVLRTPVAQCDDDSLASTCALDDDSTSLRTTSRGPSSVCLPAISDISEAADVDVQSDDSVRAPCALWAGAFRLAKVGGRCEDAFFFTSSAVGVADGVGQMVEYAAYGIDAAAYADEVMELAALALAAMPEEASPRDRAAGAISKAETASSTFGATTVTVADLKGSTLGVSNLGDSGFMLLRPKPWGMELIQRSREMNHGWNCPYQLTRVPDALKKAVGDRTFDSAADAEGYSIDVEVGDLLLLYTDGLTDNLHWYEIQKLTDDAVGANANPTKPRTPPSGIAQVLVQAASQRSVDDTADTPFSKNARRHRRYDCRGGKIDDVTVVAAWITDADHSGQQTPKEEIVLGSRDDPAESRIVRV